MSQQESRSLLDYVEMVWRRRLLVVAVLVTMTGAAVGVSLLETPSYVATARLSLARQVFDANFNVQVQEVSDRQMEKQVATLQGREVTALARAEGATSVISATAAPLSNLITITAQDPDPQQAARTANAYASAFVVFETEQSARVTDAAAVQLQDRLDVLQGQIDPLLEQIRGALPAGRADAQLTVGPVLASLQQQQASTQTLLSQLQIRSAVASDNSNVTVIEDAVAPAAPASPKPLQDGLFAAVLALVLGVSLAILLDVVQRRRARPGAAHSVGSELSPASSAEPVGVGSDVATRAAREESERGRNGVGTGLERRPSPYMRDRIPPSPVPRSISSSASPQPLPRRELGQDQLPGASKAQSFQRW